MVRIKINSKVKQEFEGISLGIALTEDVQVRRDYGKMKSKIKEVEEKVMKNIKIENLKTMP